MDISPRTFPPGHFPPDNSPRQFPPDNSPRQFPPDNSPQTIPHGQFPPRTFHSINSLDPILSITIKHANIIIFSSLKKLTICNPVIFDRLNYSFKRQLYKQLLFVEVHSIYCDTELFHPVCEEGSVIVMSQARYGRMELSRCVEIDMGFLGCERNVLDIVDKKCSGRRECQIRVPDPELENTKPCLKELKTYLDATYSCIPRKLSC